MNKNNYLLINDESGINAKVFINKEYIISYKIEKLKYKVVLDNGDIIENHIGKDKIDTYNLHIGLINSPCIEEKYIINFKTYDEAINFLNINNLIENFIKIKARELTLSEEENDDMFINTKYIIDISIENEEKWSTSLLGKRSLNINNKIMINKNDEIIQNFVIVISLVNGDIFCINYVLQDLKYNIYKKYFCSYDEAISYLTEIELI